MSQEWIEKLADEVKHKGQEAAESYGRQLHRAGIVAEQGKTFFTALVLCLEQDFIEMRARLQGSAVSCETSVQREGPATIHLTRSRFPWFDATLKHAAEDIVLEYEQGRGVAGEQVLHSSTDRQVAHFSFLVDASDKLLVTESFDETQRQFSRPEDLAKHIVELLFRV